MRPDASVKVSIDERVATVTLASPPANALGVAVTEGLSAALDQAEQAGARVVVVRSEVDGYFAAGADIKLLAQADVVAFGRYLDGVRGVIERIAGLKQVSIAAIDGYALGGGLELAMACTLRVTSPRARLGLPEIKLGLFPGAGGTQRLPRLIGRGPALDLLLTGRNVTGEEAVALGLSDRCAGHASAEDVAAELASRLATGPFEALSATIRCVDAARDLPLGEGMAVEREELVRLFDSSDGREGVRAFVEKRPAGFA